VTFKTHVFGGGELLLNLRNSLSLNSFFGGGELLNLRNSVINTYFLELKRCAIFENLWRKNMPQLLLNEIKRRDRMIRDFEEGSQCKRRAIYTKL